MVGRTGSPPWLHPAVLVGGGIGAFLLGLALAIPGKDAALLALVASGSALAVATLGRFVVVRFETRPLRDEALLVAVVGVAASVLGVAVAARAMFISSHDFNSLAVVLVAAGSAAGAAAVHLGGRVGQASQAVGELARGIGRPDAEPVTVEAPTRELAALAEQIRVVSADLERSRSREAALDRSRRELFTWISHDLRAPLASIRAMAEALEEGIVTDIPTVTRYHSLLRAEADRLSSLVDDLFELSRLQAGRPDLRLEAVPLEGLVEEVVASMRARAAREGVVLRPRVTEAVEVRVSVPEFSRALANLVDNAIRHTPRGGQVVVEARADGDIAVIAVEDTCGGIPGPDLERVFDTAFRGDAARGRHAGSGGGLGLTIARGLVEAHHGSIAVDNRSAGCRFTIRWPRLGPAA